MKPVYFNRFLQGWRYSIHMAYKNNVFQKKKTTSTYTVMLN